MDSGAGEREDVTRASGRRALAAGWQALGTGQLGSFKAGAEDEEKRRGWGERRESSAEALSCSRG